MNDSHNGFMSMSKAYMEYDKRGRIGKLRFWIRVPRAYFRWWKQVRRDANMA